MSTLSADEIIPQSYLEGRQEFRQNLPRVRLNWPDARLLSHMLNPQEDLSIDWITAPPIQSQQKLLMITAGQHGVEGFVGTAVLQLFFQELLDQLNPSNTGVLFVHCLNPWGMQHKRRYNLQGVDLNRNFIWGAFEDQSAPEKYYDPTINLDYQRLDYLLRPQSPIQDPFLAKTNFLSQVVRGMLFAGQRKVTTATLLGQYHTPKGIYYGGDHLQDETSILMKLYRETIQPYDQIVHIDIHTGFGPRYQMSIVNSNLESGDSPSFMQRFNYPRVVKASGSEFYRIQGDMIDYIYSLVKNTFPEKQVYATTFEFGTFGDSLPALIRSLQIEVLENQFYWFGAQNEKTRLWVEHEYREFYAPSEPAWLDKALADARLAYRNILAAEKYI